MRPTELLKKVETGLAFRSIGYKAVSLPGLAEDLNIDFSSSQGTITNDGMGRVMQRPDSPDKADASDLAPGCYCTGWVKNGPTGVIATTMEDAFSTADSIIEDWVQDRPFMNGTASRRGTNIGRGWDDIQAIGSFTDPVSWPHWRSIDRFEKQIGGERGGKPRAKIRSVQQMLLAAKNAEA